METSRRKMKLGTKVLIGVVVFIFIGVLSRSSGSNEKEQQNSSPAGTGKEKSHVTIGQKLRTEYFDIVVNGVLLKDRVNTGNEFADLKSENGTRYLIINATFTNTSKESRMLFDGSVWMNINGQDYEFDKSETILLDGWGLLLDEINPLTSKTTNLVYKVPSDTKGAIVRWQPGRANQDQVIYLGTL